MTTPIVGNLQTIKLNRGTTLNLSATRLDEDGVIISTKALVRTYSDRGVMIEREGLVYSEAIDPAELGRTYTETDIPVPKEDDGTDL